MDAKRQVEAVIFACGEAAPREKVAAAVGVSAFAVDRMVEAINEEYDKAGSPFFIARLGDAYQMATREEYAPVVRAALELRRSTPLSQAALETLAIVAYNQPVTRPFIEQVRGVDSSGIVASLCEKGLIEEAGRLELPGRPIAYRTTAAFLLCFGLSSLDELPDAACLGEEPPPPEEEEEQLAFET